MYEHTPMNFTKGTVCLLKENGDGTVTRLLRFEKGTRWGYLPPKAEDATPVVTVLRGRILLISVRLGEIGYTNGTTEKVVVSGERPTTVFIPSFSYSGIKILDDDTELLYTSPREIPKVSSRDMFGEEIWLEEEPLDERTLNVGKTEEQE